MGGAHLGEGVMMAVRQMQQILRYFRQYLIRGGESRPYFRIECIAYPGHRGHEEGWGLV